MSFSDVEDRLVEAVITAAKMPDRESGWHSLRAYWPDIVREAGTDYDARGGDMVQEKLRPLPCTRSDIAEMDEAFGWMAHVPDKDRRLVGLAVTALAAGAKQVPWARLLRPMRLKRGKDGLRKRYSRAIYAICTSINRCETRL